jgi:ATP-dependent Clp protease adaptor protein ClpS
MSATATKEAVKRQATKPKEKPRPAPMYHVVLLDDDDHTYEYVIEMLGKLFGYGEQKAYLMAEEVDATGRVIVETTTLERAEFKRDQIHAYGADWRMERSKGSMSATVEPAE